ncbi:MAG: hypothetical protein GYB67_18125 [Chloroflexi bacterium]|nr:hypothetical protein [Chloroflexota bacterium]
MPPAPPPTYAPTFDNAPNYGGYTEPPIERGAQPTQVSAQAARGPQPPEGYTDHQPPLSASTAQYFLPAAITAQQALRLWEQRTSYSAAGFSGARLAYRPVLLAQVGVRFQDRKTNQYTVREYAYRVPEVQRAGIVHWEDFEATPIDTRGILSGPAGDDAFFGELSGGITDSKRLTALRRELTDMIYSTKRVVIPYNPTLKIYGDIEGDYSRFQSNVVQAAREARDKAVDALAEKTQNEIDKLDDRRSRVVQRLDAERKELEDRRREELYTTGEAVLGLLRGRTSYTLSRMSRSRVYSEQSRGAIAGHELEIRQLDDELAKVERDFEQNVREINEQWAQVATEVEDHVVSPYKKDITADLFGIGWIPQWYVSIGGQHVLLPAYDSPAAR